jgi:hypothetical protein
MSLYNYRATDLFGRRVVSMAVLGDDDEDWRPDRYEFEELGCRGMLQFLLVKLLDFRGRESWLESHENPFAAIVLAHLKNLETRGDMEARLGWKVRLIRGLYERGLEADDVRQLFKVIDWLLTLPKDLDKRFDVACHQIEEEKKVEYISSVERLAIERGKKAGRQEGLQKGRQQGMKQGLQQGMKQGMQTELRESIELGLEHKFGKPGLTLMSSVRAIKDLDVLRAVRNTVFTAKKLDDVRGKLPT